MDLVLSRILDFMWIRGWISFNQKTSKTDKKLLNFILSELKFVPYLIQIVKNIPKNDETKLLFVKIKELNYLYINFLLLIILNNFDRNLYDPYVTISTFTT